jgi:hypothetical protein
MRSVRQPADRPRDNARETSACRRGGLRERTEPMSDPILHPGTKDALVQDYVAVAASAIAGIPASASGRR